MKCVKGIGIFLELIFLLSVCITGALLQEDGNAEVKIDINKNFVFNDGDVQELNDVQGNYELVEEEDVLILTRHNFNHVIHTRDYVLVEFYAPWCGHCKSLAPEYSEASKQLKASETNVTIAKVDATVETELAKEYGIQGFPSIFLFYKGVKTEEYNGERTADGIVTFMETRADPDWKPPPSHVVELTTETFKEYLAKKPLVLVLFYAEYCQHCQKIKPEYINAAKALLQYGVPLAQIEGTKHKEIADEFKIRGWPTLQVFRHGKAFEYKGARETKGIISYMKEQLQSPSKNCQNLQEIENRIERYMPTVIGVFSSEKSVFYQEFLAVANYLRSEPLRFIHTFNKKVGKALGIKKEAGEAIIVKKPTVFLSDYESKESKLIDTTKTGDEIAEFIRETYRPLVGQRNKQNQVFFYSAKPLVVVYYDANFDHQYEKASQIIRNKVVEVAKDFPQITFAVANEEDYADELEAVKLGDSGVDVNVVWYGKSRLKYRMEPVDDFDGSDLRSFVHQAEDGNLTPVWKSQPIPKRQEGPVFVAVADSYEKSIFKAADKDVVFYVYAPWCGHCKEFDKTFKKLAKQMQSEHLLFAKMDGVGNDLPPGLEIRGYPTIFFLKAASKHEPVLYEGDRSLGHVKKFIKEHSTFWKVQDEL